MPFTLSHPAAVLPLRRWTPALPFTALVVGSMAPDAEYYLPFEPFPRDSTHSFVGVATVDLVIGLVSLVLALVMGPPLAALVPRPWGERVREWSRAGIPRSPLAGLLVIVALVVGSLTHVTWDAFTHINGQVVDHVEVFRRQLGHYQVFRWLQYGSSVFGLVVIGTSLWRHRWWGFQRLSAAERGAWVARGWVVRAVPVLIIVSGIALAAYRSQRVADDPHGTGFLIITGAGEGVLIALGSWALAYWIRELA